MTRRSRRQALRRRDAAAKDASGIVAHSPAVLEVIESEQLLAKVTAQSPAWHAALRGLVALRPDLVKEVRGAGYMVGNRLLGPGEHPLASLFLCTVVAALVLTAVNMFGGFAVTQRMLAMFRR